MISKWSNKFTWTAIIQGAIVTALSIMLFAFVITTPYPKHLISTILTLNLLGYIEWSSAGLGLYLIVGVIVTGLTAQFYHHFEIRLEKKYHPKSIANTLAWTHLILMNIGITAASLMMIQAGYLGDTALMPTKYAGWGWNISQVSEKILNQYIVPVGAMLLITAIGAVAGGIGFLIVYFKS